MKLASLDLNLLVVLDAVLREQSVSRAAERLGSTQPAVSRALGRLRAWFGDPLLARARNGMVPTPVAMALAGEVRDAVDRLQRLAERRDAFDPRVAERTFRLTMSEYPQLAIAVPLLVHLRASAPRTTLEVRPWSLEFPAALEAGELDAAVCPPATSAPGLHSCELLRDDLVVVVRRGHPAAAKPLTVASYAALEHVVSAPNGRPGSVIDDLLDEAGHPRRVAMRLPSVLALPSVVVRTDCCATLPERLARMLADPWGLTVLPLPLAVPALAMHLFWHPRLERDAAHAWLRKELRGLLARRAPSRPGTVSRLDLHRRRQKTL